MTTDAYYSIIITFCIKILYFHSVITNYSRHNLYMRFPFILMYNNYYIRHLLQLFLKIKFILIFFYSAERGTGCNLQNLWYWSEQRNKQRWLKHCWLKWVGHKRALKLQQHTQQQISEIRYGIDVIWLWWITYFSFEDS